MLVSQPLPDGPVGATNIVGEGLGGMSRSWQIAGPCRFSDERQIISARPLQIEGRTQAPRSTSPQRRKGQSGWPPKGKFRQSARQMPLRIFFGSLQGDPCIRLGIWVMILAKRPQELS
jgi:hypothetical protein